MNNKKISIISFISFLILVTVGTSYYIYKNPTEIKKCKNLETEQEINNCMVETAVETSNVSFCSRLNNDIKGPCKRNIFIKQKNLEGCNELKEEFELDSYLCISGVAKETKDISLCSDIPFTAAKEACVSNIAIETQNIELCKNIADETKKDFCFMKIAQTSKNIKICENIQNEDDLKLCISEYDLVLGEKPDCNLLEKEYQELCKENVK